MSLGAKDEKQADAYGVLAGALATTVATKLLTGEPLGVLFLPSLITMGGVSALSESVQDLIAPRIEMIIGDKIPYEVFVTRAGVAAGVTMGMMALSGVPGSLRAAGGAAIGSVVGTYVYQMTNPTSSFDNRGVIYPAKTTGAAKK